MAVESNNINPFLCDDVPVEYGSVMNPDSIVDQSNNNPFLFEGGADLPYDDLAGGIVSDGNPFCVPDSSDDSLFAAADPSANFFSGEIQKIATTQPASLLDLDLPSGEHFLPPETLNVQLMDTELIVTSPPNNSRRGSSNGAVPPRPPLPSKETKELILSVTGALESTTESLMEKYRIAKTPSPTHFRDISTPSPPGDPEHDELLDASFGKNALITESYNAEPPMLTDTTHDSPSIPPTIQKDTANLNTFVSPQQDVMTNFGEPQLSSVTDFNVSYETPMSLDGHGLSLTSPTVPIQSTGAALFSTGAALFGETNTGAKVADLLGVEIAPVTASSAEKDPPTADLLSGSAASLLDSADFFSGFTAPVNSAAVSPMPPSSPVTAGATKSVFEGKEDFDAFAMRFEEAQKSDLASSSDPFDPFEGSKGTSSASVWGGEDFGDFSKGFDQPAFDAFLSISQPFESVETQDSDVSANVVVQQPSSVSYDAAQDSDEDKELAVVIKPLDQLHHETDQVVPKLTLPPRSPVPIGNDDWLAVTDKADDATSGITEFADEDFKGVEPTLERSISAETPPTPLFDEDQSQPIEEFPRAKYEGEGWEMQLRQPNKKKITGQRYWKKVFVHLNENGVLQLFNQKGDKDPFQELPLQPCYAISDIGAQQFDQYGKIFTVKLQYVFYKERPGVRPGQVTKAERITSKLSKFANYALQGDYEGVKEFGSDLKKMGLPIEHAPQISELLKLGSQTYLEMKEFSCAIEEAMFRLSVHRDRALNYKTEEVQITTVDELYVEQNKYGSVLKQLARVRVFFLAFISGMNDVEMGINDLTRQGKEIVGRHDIIPVITEEWIRLEEVEFHCTVDRDRFEDDRIIQFKPPDACYIELLRFRVRPPKNRELPLQVKAVWNVQGTRVELRSDVLVPGFTSRKLGQIPCEEVSIRFPLPECWIYLFRVEKHFRYGSVKAAHRRTGKIKGLERILGAVEPPENSLMEVSSGQAKYEHQHRSIVWRVPRLPKEGQGAYTNHTFICKINLGKYDQMPEDLDTTCHVEFVMPITTVSHCVIRSLSVAGGNPPEKYVKYLARYEYKVEMDFQQGPAPVAEYVAATTTADKPAEPIPPTINEASSDSEDSE